MSQSNQDGNEIENQIEPHKDKGCATVRLLLPFQFQLWWECYDDAGHSVAVSFNDVSETLPIGSKCELMCEEGYQLQSCKC